MREHGKRKVQFKAEPVLKILNPITARSPPFVSVTDGDK